ncbi:MAG: hypothetical protein ABWX57_07360 [Aeromicrobium sp.]
MDAPVAAPVHPPRGRMVDELPRNQSGKPLERVLRDDLEAATD